MATTKTIQPTGETITIPAMTDRPDASVFATDVSRITDAVNSQNQALLNLKNAVNLATIGTISTLDNLKSDLVTVANGMSTGENKPVMFNGASSTAPFDNGKTYYGTLCVEYKASNNLYFSVIFHSFNGEIVSVGYDRGGWTIEQLALKSELASINRYFTSTGTNRNDVLHSICTSIRDGIENGHCITCTLNFSGTLYCGNWWKANATVIFGIMFSPNSAGGFYFRDSSGDSTATSTTF